MNDIRIKLKRFKQEISAHICGIEIWKSRKRMHIRTEGEPASNARLAEDRPFVSLPMIRPKSLEERTYQIELSHIVTEQNTLAVLPTGLGKTAIALLAIAHYLSLDSKNHCLVLAPTRVLVHQHFSFLRNHLTVPEDEIGVLTGEDTIENRKEVWKKKVVCATPQVMVSDMRRGNCEIESFALIVFDEVHRAVGNHAYCTIGATYNELKNDGRILGITASLPSDREKVEEIISKLKISKIETRDERDQDVKPYVFKTDVEWIEISLPTELKEIQKLIKESLDFRLKLLEDAALIKSNRYGSITLKDLLRLRLKVDQIQSSQLRNALFSSIRLLHALNLMETQSLAVFKAFMDRLYARRRGFGMNELLSDSRVRLAIDKTQVALVHGIEHPKIVEVLRLCRGIRKGDRVIVFASYRDTVDQIYSELVKNGFRAGYLIGKSGQTGQSQKKQIQSLEELRQGTYDILVATQVGEEGLDVAECNLVVFYDNVPSAVRFVQRKGRTGRKKEGRICVLLTKGTRDEAYYWLSRRRLKDVKRVASALSLDKRRGGPLDAFLREHQTEENLPTIHIDTRELAEFVDKLRYRGAIVEVEQLEIGDFVASNEIVIERKTIDDFVKSVYDGRLFKQIANMSDKYPRPILVIQGERKDLSGIGESAFYGAVASIISDFKVPVFFAPSERDVVEIVYHIARREQIEKKKDTRIREGRKPMTLADTQRYIVSGIPGVSSVLADRLLSKMSTVEHLFSASEVELQNVEGIGEVMAQRIRQLATAKYISTKSQSELLKEGENGGPHNDFWSELEKKIKSHVQQQKEEIEPLENKNVEQKLKDFDIPPPPSTDED
jgi:ERCC4-related helicase/gas vesicle protein